MAMYIVTVKLARNPGHDPHNKKIGICPVSGLLCTDVTGEHHSYVVVVSESEQAIEDAHNKGFTHITRIERVRDGNVHNEDIH